MIAFERGLEAFASIDDGYKFLVVAFLVLVAYFHALLPLYPATKQRAWILTALGSSLFTIASLPFVAHVVTHRGNVSNLVRIPWWSDAACRFFQAYLLSDLVIGSFYYANQINLVTGWVHHIAYITLVDFVIRWGWSHIFALAGIMELPTFHLAIATLQPKLRHNVLFAVTFFATRIAFHVGLFLSYIPKSTRMEAVGGSLLPAGLFAAAFPMHAMWFTGCIKGFIRRSKARHEATLEGSSSEDKLVQVVAHPEEPGMASSPTEFPNKEITSTFDDVPIKEGEKKHTKLKPYPPSTQTLPSTAIPHSPPRVVIMSPSTRARSRSSSVTSVISPPSSPTMTYSPTQTTLLSRRRSFVSAEREESLRRLVSTVAGLAEDAIAQSPPMQSAVAVGRGMARTYKAYRGRAFDGVRGRGLSWRRSNSDAVEAY